MIKDGIIIIDKEKDWTSHDVVAKTRGILRQYDKKIKVGHTGTLDPNATGVLPICIGKATKLSNFFLSKEKKYICDLIFGIKTDSDDFTGEIIERSKIPSEDEAIKAIKSFEGEYNQIPPLYSAKKINGKKLYEYAKNNETIDIKPSLINIYSISNIQKNNDIYRFTVSCSKGTYIRSLCRDIGESLGLKATMGDLIRVQSGEFELKDANKIKDLNKDNILDKIIPIENFLKHYPKVIAPESANKYLYNGNKISINYINEVYKEEILFYDNNNKLIGIYILEGDFYIPLIFLYKR